METPEIKYLIGALIGIDIVFFIFFIILIKRFGKINRKGILEKETQLFESVIKDADKMEKKLTEKLNEKYHFVNKLNEQLDKRIASLNILMNRTSIILSSQNNHEKTDKGLTESISSKKHEILQLAGDGCDVEEIAHKLSLPKGEVMLVLNLSKSIHHLIKDKGMNN